MPHLNGAKNYRDLVPDPMVNQQNYRDLMVNQQNYRHLIPDLMVNYHNYRDLIVNYQAKNPDVVLVSNYCTPDAYS